MTWFASSFINAKNTEIIQRIKIIREGNQLGSVHIRGLLWYIKQKNKPDIIVDQFHGIPFYLPLVSRNVKVVGYIHEVARRVWFDNHLKFPLNYIFGLAGFIIEPLTFKLFYKNTPFITVSESTRDDLLTYGIETSNIYVIKNGVTTFKMSYKKSKAKTVMFLGALAKDKGIYDAIECFAKINKNEPDCKYWVVGRGSQQFIGELTKYAKKLGLDENIIFWGYVSNKKKFELLAKSHIMINPSEHEGWGLVNIEANAMGTPVVAYNVHGVKDSVINNYTGKLVCEGDIDSLATSAIALLRNKKEYYKYQQNALKWASKFSWEKSGKETLKVIENL